MGLFSPADIALIEQAAKKSKETLKPTQASGKSINSDHAEIEKSMQAVLDYFKDSPAILITTRDQLHEYVLNTIEAGYCGIDTETTGLDRINDTIVGTSLYYPGGVECYIPSKHIVHIMEQLYPNQLTYEQVGEELQLLVDAKTKMIFANADFDIPMIYKDLKVDFVDTCYYDVQVAWRCLKENEPSNRLKDLYIKYVLGGKGNPKKFSDFFSARLFPYCKPEVAKFYAANDAKITYDLFAWQLPYVTKSHPKCQKNHLEKIADLVWNIEMPMVKVCAMLHRAGVYLDPDISSVLHNRYSDKLREEESKLAEIVQGLIDTLDFSPNPKRPFRLGSDFNPNSQPHVKYLLNDMMGCNVTEAGKEVLTEINQPVTKQILAVRGAVKLLSTYVDKLPSVVAPDGRIHATFKSIGADCIIGDSLVLTNHGYRPIVDLFDGSEIDGEYATDSTQLIDKNLNVVSTSHRVVYHNTPTIRLRLRGGFSVEGTPNHPIICSMLNRDDVRRTSSNICHLGDNVEFRRLDDISVGDAICIPVGYDIFPTNYVPTNFVLKDKYREHQTDCSVPEYFNEDFAELLGMYFADGSIHDSAGHFSIRISNKDQDVINRTTELVNRVFGLTTRTTWSHTTWATEFGNKRIECIRDVLGRGDRNKYICKQIMQSPKSVVCAFIRGTTLDSNYDPKRQRLAINYFRKDSANFVHQSLANMGIISSLSIQHSGDVPHYRVSVSGDFYKKFLDIVGVVQSSKRDLRDTYAKSKFVIADNKFFAYVEDLEYGMNDVYDVTVPESHSFIANGMINHNTGRMSSTDPKQYWAYEW